MHPLHCFRYWYPYSNSHRKQLYPAFPHFPVRNSIYISIVASLEIAIKLQNGWFPAPDAL